MLEESLYNLMRLAVDIDSASHPDVNIEKDAVGT